MNKAEKSILKKIKSGEIKMKPRWWFVVQNASVNTVFWLSVMMAVVGASYLWYFLDLYRPTEWKQYAELGVGLMVEDFPTYGASAMVVCGILGSWLCLKIGDNYKNDWWKVATKTWVIIILGTTVWLLLEALL